MGEIKETITLTFGESAENHKGMQMLGNLGERGLSIVDLETIREKYEQQGFKCILYDLGTIPKNDVLDIDIEQEDAKLLVVKKAITNSNELYQEQLLFPRDKKALMYGRVVNKHARHNLCFSDFEQVANYEQGKGTVISFARTPLLSDLRKKLPELTGIPLLTNLQCEANYYYDISKTYIGFHGDTERRVVIGVRLGETFPLHYQWFYKNKSISQILTLELDGGDMYFMSEKATGWDWKSYNKPTLRHAAGYSIIKT